MNRDRLAKKIIKSMNAVDRIDHPNGVILIADGGSDDPNYDFQTLWAAGANEDNLTFGRSLYFRKWGKLGPSTPEIRLEAARQDAESCLKV